MILSNNRIDRSELAFVYNDYWKTWSRLLYMYDGTYVEVDLTPTTPERVLTWEKVRSINIRRHRTHPVPTDRRYRCVKAGTTVFNVVIRLMGEHLTAPEIAALFFTDYLPLIDWSLWERYNNGGCFFKDCKKGH